MYDMAKKGREAMKSKARRLSSEKDSKVDSSTWSPAEPINADVKTGMRPITRRAYKSGGKVMGEDCAPRADRMPRKAGGKVESEKAEAAEYAKAKINRNAKAANEEREGKKHIGGLKTGGRAKRADGGMADIPETGEPRPPAKNMIQQRAYGASDARSRRMVKDAVESIAANRSLKTGGRAKREDGGRTPASTANKITTPSYREELERRQNPQATKPPPGRSTTGPENKPADMSTMTGDEAAKFMESRKYGGKTKKAGGGYVPTGTKAGSPVTPGMKDGGRTKKMGGGMIAGLTGGLLPGLAAGALGKKDDKDKMRKGGRAERKAGGRVGKTNINIVIASKPTGDAGGMGMTPPGAPRPPGGVPVPVPPPGAGAPPAAPMPMPVPMPMPAGGPPGGPPMGRKRGGRVYRSYKDMDAGAASGMGRLEKTEIQKHKR